jgi:hypothetical protein
MQMTRQFKQVGSVLNSVGWFVPPYVSFSLLETVALAVTRAQGKFTQYDLEKVLAFVCRPYRLASMVVNRYSQMQVFALYQQTIAEAVWAHFAGLRHVAVGGLIPVVEGIGRELAKQPVPLAPEIAVRPGGVVSLDTVQRHRRSTNQPEKPRQYS